VSNGDQGKKDEIREQKDFIGFFKSKLGQEFVQLLYNLSLFLANICLFYLFSKYFNIHIFQFIVIYLLSFLFSSKLLHKWKSYIWFLAPFVLYKLELGLYLKVTLVILLAGATIGYIYWLYRKGESKEKGREAVPKCRITKSALIKFSIVFPRILFFNISNFLFPLLFIWLSFTGILYFKNYIQFTGKFNEFLGVITILGVILGFFQYYLKRHEEKFQNKVVNYFVNVIFPVKEFSYREFKKFVEKRSEDRKFREVKKLTDKLDSESSRLLRIALTIARSGGRVHFTNIQLAGESEMLRFSILEDLAEKEQKTDCLKYVYKRFFEEKKEKILKSIKSEDIREFRWILIGNINFLDEASIQLFSLPSAKKEEPDSYSEFLSKVELEILNKIIPELIF